MKKPRALSATSAIAVLASFASSDAGAEGGCPTGMVAFDRFCIDAHEAHLEIVDATGKATAVHSPYRSPKGVTARAASAAGAIPQGHVTQREAEAACRAAEKRLCSDDEWLAACRGEPRTRYPYGTLRRAGYCNDDGREPLPALFGRAVAYTPGKMNDERLNQVPGSLARGGAFPSCRSSAPVFDMVGNLHEWTADPAGTMRGGFYLDTESLGRGCDYAAIGHDADYADYSTGFRCCADR